MNTAEAFVSVVRQARDHLRRANGVEFSVVFIHRDDYFDVCSTRSPGTDIPKSVFGMPIHEYRDCEELRLRIVEMSCTGRLVLVVPRLQQAPIIAKQEDRCSR